MATDRVLEGLRLTPDDVAEHEFAHGFRGYDVHEVRSFLRIVSGEMSRLTDVRDSDTPIAPAAAHARVADELSREQLVELVGDESAKVLRAAEDAAAEIRARAESNVEQMLKDASAEAAQLRAGGDQQRADAVEAAESDLAGAKDKAAAILAQAEVDAQKVRDAAVDQGRSMMAETQTAKDSVLRDLARKRKSARRELAQLRAGIDQLHESYDELRSMLDTSSAVVGGAVDDARRAAANAAERFDRSDREDDVREVSAVAESIGGQELEAPVADVKRDGEAESSAKVDLVDAEATVEEVDPSPGVDEIPTVADAVAVREDKKRRVLRRDPKIEPTDPVGEVATAAATEVEEIAADETGDELSELPDLLDDGPVPSPAEPPPLFGRRDTNVDELFARIRTSREGAVAQAHRVLDGDAESDGVPDVGVEQVETPESSEAEPPVVLARESAELFAALDLSVSDFGSDVSRVLKRMLADQLNEVLDEVRRADSIGDVEDIIAADSVAGYGKAARTLLQQAAARGAGSDTATVDISSVVDAVSRDVGSSIRDRVGELLEDEDGVDQRIRSAFREWRRERADEVAGVSVASAFNLGVLSLLSDGARVEWMRRDGQCGHPDCAENASADGVVVGGEFPSGHTNAPMGPGCRCLVVESAK